MSLEAMAREGLKKAFLQQHSLNPAMIDEEINNLSPTVTFEALKEARENIDYLIGNEARARLMWEREASKYSIDIEYSDQLTHHKYQLRDYNYMQKIYSLMFKDTAKSDRSYRLIERQLENSPPAAPVMRNSMLFGEWYDKKLEKLLSEVSMAESCYLEDLKQCNLIRSDYILLMSKLNKILSNYTEDELYNNE